LNWLIFLGFYAAWRLLLREVCRFTTQESAEMENSAAILWSGSAIFLSCSLSFDSVARVAPDMLVSALFVLATALVLHAIAQPAVRSAALLGITLGAGCWVKGVFFALSCIFLSALYFGLLARGQAGKRWLAAATVAFFLIFAPLVGATSWSWGHFTMGVTGPLNYAFHVNNLPHNTNWQGGPPEFGAPIHHTQQLIADLPVFGFAAPFRTTYPPYNNLAYWYEGYRHFYSVGNQFWNIVANVILLRQLVKHPFIWAWAVSLIVVLAKPEWRRATFQAFRLKWIAFLPALLGFAAYMLVHVEDRYLSPFLLIASLVPLLALLDPTLRSRRKIAVVLTAIFVLGAGAELAIRQGETLKAALHRVDFRQNESWKVAGAMPGLGINPGDPVALIDDSRPTIQCGWAYTAQLRIVAQFGGLPNQDPTGLYLLRHPNAPAFSGTDYSAMYRSLSPEQRAQVLTAFRTAGAQAVLAYNKPSEDPAPGWEPISGTNAWIYRFAK
jgi:hypothetical protein